MKRFSYFLLLFLLLGTTAFCGCSALSTPKPTDEIRPEAYLRIHVRADDNTPEAQAVKYKVKDAIITHLSPLLSCASGKTEAMSLIRAHLAEIDGVATRILRENGFFYEAKSDVKREAFPTRVYDEITLPCGVYDALVVNLGSGAGDNWWCVAYPPLCFLPEGEAGEDYTYRSALWDWLTKIAN